MEMEKKNLAIIILAVVLAVSGIGNVILAVMVGLVEVTGEEPDTIIFGTMYGPVDADPHYAWDQASNDYQTQVFETLFSYNLSDPAMAIIPKLAASMGTWNGANYTVTLRPNVKFHSYDAEDNPAAVVNASTVKWSFDRLAYLCNFTGTQPASGPGATLLGISQLISLYMWPNGTALIKEVQVVSEYVVKFVLNYPYGVFVPLLCFMGSAILDPTVTPQYDYICDGMSGATVESISGTGPWVFQYYIAGVEARFIANENYWRTPSVIKNLVIAVITDSPARNNAMLAGDINFQDDPHPSYHAQMRADPDVVLYEGAGSTSIQYLGFNNKKFDYTQRSAMSYALNYDYAIHELMLDTISRLKSPIPMGIQYANYSFDVPYYNVTRAREYMVARGNGSMSWTDTQWETQASSAPFWTMNYTYNIGNQFREDFLILLQNNMKEIGVKVIDNGLEWDPYLDLLLNHTVGGVAGYDRLECWFVGWGADYNDPSNFVNSLMSNISASNAVQVNDPTLEKYMLDGLTETDPAVREQIYWDLQKYVVEDLRPHAYVYVSNVYDAYAKYLKGYASNAMGVTYFYPIYFD
jgi:peptide/nickel transport system substrate-binding protein